MKRQMFSWFNKKLLLLVFIISIFCFIYSSFYNNTPISFAPKHVLIAESLPDVPQKIILEKASVKHFSFFVDVVVNEKKVTTRVVEAHATAHRKNTFLFLHGMSFTSDVWVQLRSLHLVAALGHRAIAVDLPGWGLSTGKLEQSEKAQYMTALLTTLNVSRPILVSPSMSGSFSLPFLMRPIPDTCVDRLSGFIAVAPTQTDFFEPSEYFQCQLPVLIVYGSKDKHLGLQAVSNLRNMVNHEIWQISGAGHPAYLDKTDQWDKLLYHCCSKFNH